MMTSNQLPSREECIDAFGAVMAASDAAIAQMTPREQAEAAWTPTSRNSVDELVDIIREQRGMRPDTTPGRVKGGETATEDGGGA